MKMNLSIGNVMVMGAGCASHDESHRNSVASRVPIAVAQRRRKGISCRLVPVRMLRD